MTVFVSNLGLFEIVVPLLLIVTGTGMVLILRALSRHTALLEELLRRSATGQTHAEALGDEGAS
jgi:hypothetical protein